jgi:hypothetical protein
MEKKPFLLETNVLFTEKLQDIHIEENTRKEKGRMEKRKRKKKIDIKKRICL